jgi:MFS family permease
MSRDFRLLWGGHAISEFGSAISSLALPLLAVTLLAAGEAETGMLAAAGYFGWLVVSLPAGAIVDRVPKKGLMIFCDLSRAAVLAAVVVMAGTGQLGLGALYVAALAIGVLTVFAEIACWSLVPLVLPTSELVAGNSRLATTGALARIAGPPAAGLMTDLFCGVSRAVAADSLSYVVSAICLSPVRSPNPAGQKSKARIGLRAEIGEGLAFVLGHPVLRRIVLTSATSGLFRAMLYALLVVFLVRDLHANGAMAGLVFGLGGAGGVLGAIVLQPLAKRFGSARLLWFVPLTFGSLPLAIAFAPPGWGLAVVAFGLVADGFSSTVYNVLQISYRQAICPPVLLGRMNATVRWLIRGGQPIGAVLGGGLATLGGIRPALLAGAAGVWLSIFWVLNSGLRHARHLEDAATQ